MGISPESVAAVRKIIAQRDAYKFVLSCIATGDCEDPVMLAREILGQELSTEERGTSA